MKKLFYRAATLQIRDVFDVAVVLRHHPEEMYRSIDVFQHKVDLLQNRLAMIQSRYKKEAVANIDILPAGEELLRDAPEMVSRFLESAK